MMISLQMQNVNTDVKALRRIPRVRRHFLASASHAETKVKYSRSVSLQYVTNIIG